MVNSCESTQTDGSPPSAATPAPVAAAAPAPMLDRRNVTGGRRKIADDGAIGGRSRCSCRRGKANARHSQTGNYDLSHCGISFNICLRDRSPAPHMRLLTVPRKVSLLGSLRFFDSGLRILPPSPTNYLTLILTFRRVLRLSFVHQFAISCHLKGLRLLFGVGAPLFLTFSIAASLQRSSTP